MRYLSILTLVFFHFISCKKENTKHSELIDFIPNNPSIVISASNISNLEEQIKNNGFIQQFDQTDTYKKLKNDFQFCKQLKSEQPILFSYATVGKSLEYLFTIKDKNTKTKIELEENSKLYNNVSYKKLKNQKAFFTNIDSTLVISSSEILLENLIRNQQDNIKYSNNSLIKLFKTSSDSQTTIFINNEKIPDFLKSGFPSNFLSTKGWMSIELEAINGLLINGLSTNNNLSQSFAKALINTPTAKSNAQLIVPANFTEYISYNFDTLLDYTSAFENFDALIDNSSEIVQFKNDQHRVCAFKLLNKDITENLNLNSTYRNIPIYENTYYKIPKSIANKHPEYACVLNEFVLFSETLEALQNCIAHYQNKTTLNSLNYYNENKNELSNEAHIIEGIKTSSLKTQLAKVLEDESINKVNLNNFPLLTHQITYEDNYIHFNSVIKKVSPKKKEAGVSQIISINLDADINNEPQWVINHKNKEKEIIVQDINNVLYLISNKGTILWKKQLNSKIQGKITQVDLYKNRKLQLAFTTEKEFMVLDRNGNVVDPFYKKFDDGNLLPLAVFDYDKNRNYRFIVTQNKKTYMYDNKAKLVKGFSFKKASSQILQTPQHIRVGTRDYIVIAEKNGKLHILDRQGKTRTKVKSEFNYDTNPILPIKNTLIVKEKDNTINSVNIATGKTKKIDILQGNNSKFIQKDALIVKLEDNNLTIKNKTIELDYGNYTLPEIFYLNKKYYISTTDIDTQKVYLFDSNAKLLPKFPVYGQSSISLTNMNKDAKLEFSVKGETNSVLIYKIQ